MTAVHPSPSDLTPRALKFEALAQELRRGIAAGSWPLGSLLPTEKQLVESTGYSLSTVRRAVDVLVDEGLILRRQGSGMYVSSASRQRTEQRTIGVLIPDTRLYFPTVLQGIEAGLSGSGTSIALATSQYDSRVEQEAIARFVEARVDGLLITPIISDDADPGALLRRLESIPIPVVMLERRIRVWGISIRPSTSARIMRPVPSRECRTCTDSAIAGLRWRCGRIPPRRPESAAGTRRRFLTWREW